MGFLSRPNEPEKEADEIVAEALAAFNRRPTYVDTSAHRHKSDSSRLSAMLAFQRPTTTGKAAQPDDDGDLPERDSIQSGYENLR